MTKMVIFLNLRKIILKYDVIMLYNKLWFTNIINNDFPICNGVWLPWKIVKLNY